MPLHILLILVIGGVSLVVLLLHGLGRSRRMTLTNDNTPIAWVRHFPEDEVQSFIIARNGFAALVETSNGPGLIWSFGADSVGRYLRDYTLRETPKQMKIIFRDFSSPGVTLYLAPSERLIWQKILALP